MIKQISIYTENRKGALRTLVGTLAYLHGKQKGCPEDSGGYPRAGRR